MARKIFEWVGHEHGTIREVTRRLKAEGVPTRTGLPEWDGATVCAILRNPAYKGTAVYGKTRVGPYKPQRLRTRCAASRNSPRKPMTRLDTPVEEQIFIAVPALVSEDLFAAAQEQLEENRKAEPGPDAPGGDVPAPRADRLQGLRVRLPWCSDGRAEVRRVRGPTPTIAAAAPSTGGSAARSCAGPGRSGPSGWTRPCGTTSAHCLSEPERVREEYRLRRRGRRGARPVRPVSWPD